MRKMIFDSHAHYDDEAFDGDRAALLAALKDEGVGYVIDVGASAESLPKVMELAREYSFVYAALGIHPEEIGGLSEEVFSEIEAGLDDPKAAAVGEIGLDYHRDEVPRDLQKEAFRRQAMLAIERGLPIIVHSRDAAADTQEILDELYGAGGPGAGLENKGVMHCYSYSAEMARHYTEKLGFYIGIGGVLTFKNAKKLKEAAAAVSLDRILLETDCPYLAPEPHRGTRNYSGYIKYVAAVLAQIKGVSEEEVIEKTCANAMKLFGIEGEL